MQSPAETSISRALIHVLRFVVLMVGLLAVGELLIGLYGCLVDIEYVKLLRGAAQCAGAVLFYLEFLLPYLFPYHLIPVAIVALVGAIVWARLERRQS